MARSVTKIEADLLKLEEQKNALRDEQRALQRELAEAQEAAHQETVKQYWDERIQSDPDNPDVLRARAALLDHRETTVVQAAAAIVEAREGQ